MTYVYSLVRSSRKPALRRSLAGLPGAGRPRALDAGNGLWLIVSNVNEKDYGEAAIGAGLKHLDWVSRRAVAHEAVVEQFLMSRAVLPMQLFTIFASDERALEHVTRDRTRIDRILTRIEGQVEWGLRLTWDEAAAAASVEAGPSSRVASSSSRKISGASYLTRKRDLLDINRGKLAEAREDAARLYRELSRHATEARRRTSTEQGVPGSRLLLDAAYLVPAKKGSAFRAALRQGARRLASPGVVVSLTGPWPAYNFIDAGEATPKPRRRASRARA